MTTTQDKKIPQGYKMTEVGVIPEDWEVKTFKKVSKVNQGYQISISKRLKNKKIGAKKYITIQFLNNSKEIEYIDNPPGNVCCTEDDILMTRTGNTGIVVTNVNGVFHNNFFKINFKKEQFVKDYLIYFLNFQRTKKEILDKAGLSTIPDLNHNDFYSINIYFPPTIKEQKAIAMVLSDMDELIEKLDKLIAKKKLIKQGTMQELLTGKKRLAGFSGEWEVKKLGEIGEIYQPETISQEKFTENGYIVFGANGVIGRYFKYNHEKWQNIITCRGSTCGVVNKSFDKCWITGNAMVINVDKNKKIEKIFLFYVLKYQNFDNLITGSGQPQIVRTPLFEYKINIPTNKEEQKAIAQILSDMDNEIEKLEKKKEKYQQIKEGAMQVLLTGRVRLV